MARQVILPHHAVTWEDSVLELRRLQNMLNKGFEQDKSVEWAAGALCETLARLGAVPSDAGESLSCIPSFYQRHLSDILAKHVTSLRHIVVSKHNAGARPLLLCSAAAGELQSNTRGIILNHMNHLPRTLCNRGHNPFGVRKRGFVS